MNRDYSEKEVPNRRLNGEIQRLCRKEKQQDTNNKCDLIEKYQQEKDPRISAAIKGMPTKQHKVDLGAEQKEVVMIRNKDEMVRQKAGKGMQKSYTLMEGQNGTEVKISKEEIK